MKQFILRGLVITGLLGSGTAVSIASAAALGPSANETRTVVTAGRSAVAEAVQLVLAELKQPRDDAKDDVTKPPTTKPDDDQGKLNDDKDRDKDQDKDKDQNADQGTPPGHTAKDSGERGRTDPPAGAHNPPGFEPKDGPGPRGGGGTSVTPPKPPTQPAPPPKNTGGDGKHGSDDGKKAGNSGSNARGGKR